MGADNYLFISNSTGKEYNISTLPIVDLPNYLHTLLSTTVKHDIYRPDMEPTSRLLEIGFALYTSDLRAAMQNIATTLTNQIRSNNPGDNNNASIITGAALFQEPYIHVRWAWLILPIAEVTLVTFLLAACVIITRDQPLVKQSLVTLLLTRLEGWADDELEARGDQTQENLSRLAESIITRLDADERSHVTFFKAKLD